MFCTCSLHLQRYKGSAHVPRSLWSLSRIQPVGIAAANVQVADIKKITFTHILSVSNAQMSMFVHFEQPVH
jgi:hypothetical protein